MAVFFWYLVQNCKNKVPEKHGHVNWSPCTCSRFYSFQDLVNPAEDFLDVWAWTGLCPGAGYIQKYWRIYQHISQVVYKDIFQDYKVVTTEM